MPFLNNWEYFTNGTGTLDPTNWGKYQYVTLREIVNAFMLNYTGDESLLNNVKRTQVIFHAKKAIQNLSFNVNNISKSLELTIGSDLKMIMPPDYVSFVSLNRIVDGKLIPIKENRTINTAVSYQQTADNEIYIDQNTEDVVIEQSQLDSTRISAPYGYKDSESSINPTYNINKKAGVIDFSSDASGLRVVLEYICDGLENGNDSEIVVNKLAENYVYSYIRWALLDNKFNVQEYIVKRVKTTRDNNYRNAKISMSNIHPKRIIGIIASRGR